MKPRTEEKLTRILVMTGKTYKRKDHGNNHTVSDADLIAMFYSGEKLIDVVSYTQKRKLKEYIRQVYSQEFSIGWKWLLDESTGKGHVAEFLMGDY